MSEKFWEDALTEIDDKYVKETAEFLMKSSDSKLGSEVSFTEPTVITGDKKPRKKRTLFMSLGGIAAAFAIIVPVALNSGLFNITQNDDKKTFTTDSFFNAATPPLTSTEALFENDSAVLYNNASLPIIENPGDDFSLVDDSKRILWDSVTSDDYVIRLETPNTYYYRNWDTYSGWPHLMVYSADGEQLSSAYITTYGETQAVFPFIFKFNERPKLYVWKIGEERLIMVKTKVYKDDGTDSDLTFFSFFHFTDGNLTYFGDNENPDPLSVLCSGSDAFKVVNGHFLDIVNKKIYDFDFSANTIKASDWTEEIPSYLDGEINPSLKNSPGKKPYNNVAASWNLESLGICTGDTVPSIIDLTGDPIIENIQDAHFYVDEFGTCFTTNLGSYCYIPKDDPTTLFYYDVNSGAWDEFGNTKKISYNAIYKASTVPSFFTTTDKALLSALSGVWECTERQAFIANVVKIKDTFDAEQLGVCKYDTGVLLLLGSGSAYFVPDEKPDMLYFYETAPVAVDAAAPTATYHRVRNEKVTATEASRYYLNDEVIHPSEFKNDYETLKNVFMGVWNDDALQKSISYSLCFNYSRGIPGYTDFNGIATTEFGWLLNEYSDLGTKLYFIPFSNPNIMYLYNYNGTVILNHEEDFTLNKGDFSFVFYKISEQYVTEDLGSYGLELLLGEDNYSILYDMWSQPEAVLPNGKIYERVYATSEANISEVNLKVRLVSQEENKMVFEQPFRLPLTFDAARGYENAFDYKTLNVTIEKDKNGDWWVTRVESQKDLNTEGFTPAKTPEEAVYSYYLKLNSNTDVKVNNDETSKLRISLKNNAAVKTSMNWNDEFIDNYVCVVTALHNPQISTSVPKNYVVVKNELMNEWYVLPDGWDTTTETLRALTKSEIDEANEAFKPTFYDETTNISSTNPITTLFNEYFSAPIEIDITTVVERYGKDTMTSDERYQIVRKAFNWTDPEHLDGWVVPFREIPAKELDDFMQRLTGIDMATIYKTQANSGEKHLPLYCAETNCYYNHTSDGYLKVLDFISGTICNDTVKLYTMDSVVTLEYYEDRYIIKSYLHI